MGSDLCETTFADARLRERFVVNVIRAWFGGEFVTPAHPDDELREWTRLPVVGGADALTELREATAAAVREFGP